MPTSKIIYARSVNAGAKIDKGLYFDGPGKTPTGTGINQSIDYIFSLDDAQCTVESAIFHCKVLSVYTDPQPIEGTYLKYFERNFKIENNASVWAFENRAYEQSFSQFPARVTIEQDMSWTNIAWEKNATDLHCYVQFDTAANTYLEIVPGAPTSTPVSPSQTNVSPTEVNRLEWELGYAGGYTETQKSAVVEWKEGASGDVNTVNIITSNKYCEIAANTFGSGKTIYWRVKGTSIYDKESEFSNWVSFDTYIAPIIYSLEPSGINQNIEKDIVVSWSVDNCSSFVLDVLQKNVLIKTYSGTTQTKLSIPANTIPSGDISLRLKAIYDSGTYTTNATKTVEFLAYGSPSQPVQDEATVYNLASPTFTWTTQINASDSPVSWELELLKGETVIEQTGEVLGNAGSYTVLEPLENHTEYVVSVRVKNQFSLWSAWSSKTIATDFTELPKPTFDIIKSDNAVVLDIVNSNHAMFKNSDVLRREVGGSWQRIAYNLGRVTTYTDYTLADGIEYEYKIRSNAIDGAVSESDAKGTSINVRGFTFANVEELSNTWCAAGDYNKDNISVDVLHRRNIDATVYQGNIGATIETDGLTYQTLSFSFRLSYKDYNNLLKLINNSRVILYKDERGHKCYGYVTSDISEKHLQFNGYEVSFSFTQVSFIETDMYCGDGGLVLVYLDGSYRLDGSLLLTGVRVE